MSWKASPAEVLFLKFTYLEIPGFIIGRQPNHDVCDQLQGTAQFSCQVSLGGINLDNYLELAVFRIVQELMINVVKHAQATRAEVGMPETPHECKAFTHTR